jgi:hypothetical protein
MSFEALRGQTTYGNSDIAAHSNAENQKNAEGSRDTNADLSGRGKAIIA